jgi:hypothetical protein
MEYLIMAGCVIVGWVLAKMDAARTPRMDHQTITRLTQQVSSMTKDAMVNAMLADPEATKKWIDEETAKQEEPTQQLGFTIPTSKKD